MNYRKRYSLSSKQEDVDPMGSLVNLFDVAMVFAVALMVAFAIQTRMTEFLTAEDVSYIKNAGKPDMEIIIKKENKITKYKAADNTEGTGKGRRIGIAYELENGEIIYIPENNNQ